MPLRVHRFHLLPLGLTNSNLFSMPARHLFLHGASQRVPGFCHPSRVHSYSLLDFWHLAMCHHHLFDSQLPHSAYELPEVTSCSQWHLQAPMSGFKMKDQDKYLLNQWEVFNSFMKYSLCIEPWYVSIIGNDPLNHPNNPLQWRMSESYFTDEGTDDVHMCCREDG